MKTWLKYSFSGVAVVFVSIQFFGPSLNHPAADPARDALATNPPPARIAGMLHNACYDCHSVQTQWPWYSRVAPVSWWLADHVNDGRRKLNFSDWPQDPKHAAKKWSRVSEEVDYEEMPLKSYTWMHPAARLSRADRDELMQWADGRAKQLRAEGETKSE